MDKKKIEKAGQFISYGLRALINDDKEEEQDHLSYLQLEDLHKPDTFIVVRQYERNYRIEEQVKVNEYLEVDSFDDYEIYYEIYKHDNALVGKNKAANGDSASDSRTPKAILNYQATAIYEALCESHPLLKKEMSKYTEFGKSLKPLAQRYALDAKVNMKQIFARRKEGSCYSVLKIE